MGILASVIVNSISAVFGKKGKAKPEHYVPSWEPKEEKPTQTTAQQKKILYALAEAFKGAGAKIVKRKKQ